MANRKGIREEVKKAKLKRQGDLVQIQKGNLIATAYKDRGKLLLPRHVFHLTGMNLENCS